MWRLIRIALVGCLFLASGPIQAEDETALPPWVVVRDALCEENVRKPPFRTDAARKRHEQVPAAVEAALTWLADHQSPDGRWEANGYCRWSHGARVTPTSSDPGCGLAIYDVGVTGLALTAFLVAGYTGEGEHAFDEAVSKGLAYLKRVQDADGCFGERVVSPVPQRHHCYIDGPEPPVDRNRQTYVYNHATATIAMVEAYGMTGREDWKASAQGGLDFVALTRNPYFAWRYGIKPGDNDTSVTAWMTMALKTAFFVNRTEVEAGQDAPFRIDEYAFDGPKAWVDKMTDFDCGRVGYMRRGGRSSRQDDLKDRFPGEKSEALTAAGMLMRIFIGEDSQRSPVFLKGLELLEKCPPVWNEEDGSIDMIYWHFATLAVHLNAGRRTLANAKHERTWGEWLQRIESVLLDSQRQDGEVSDAKGSWDPAGAWGRAGGRVYATALNTLTLLTPVRYERRTR